MRDEFRDAPEGARGWATGQEETRGSIPIPTYPAHGSGYDARHSETPSWTEHHRNIPAEAGAGGRAAVETQKRRAPCEQSAREGGGTDQRSQEIQMRSVGSEQSGSDAWDACHMSAENQKEPARIQPSRRRAGQIGGDHDGSETQAQREPADLRFTDPLVAEIVQLHRMRRRWMKAKNALILQGKAFGRAVCDGDKDAGTAAYERVSKGATRPGDEDLSIALVPFMAAIAHFDESIRPIERRLEKLAKQLPIAAFVNETRGLGFGSVATIVGEAGDLSAYPSVAGVWKRMGLAVIDGDGRQRKVADAERALIHGYNPERRSVVWNAGNNVIGGMGNGKRPMAGEDIDAREDWTHYEKLFVHRLRYEAARDPAMRLPDTKEGKESYTKYAAARAKRFVEKRLLKDMTLAWRRAVGRSSQENHDPAADRPMFLEAAE